MLKVLAFMRVLRYDLVGDALRQGIKLFGEGRHPFIPELPGS
jgi:hypothetical protein